jgi:cytochrome c biogenesis protein CcdA
MIGALGTAAVLGLLTAISPCPLATNIAAVGFVGRQAASPRRTAIAGVCYVVGRAVCYAALAMLVTAGVLAAARTSASLGRVLGVLVGPILLLTGGVLLGWIPVPALGGRMASRGAERLAKRGGPFGAFLLGGLLALSFCPSSAALFFGSLIPLATRAESMVAVPLIYGVATGLPVLAIAVLLAAGSQGLGRVFGSIERIETWLRPAAGATLVAVGLYLCWRSYQAS